MCPGLKTVATLAQPRGAPWMQLYAVVYRHPTTATFQTTPRTHADEFGTLSCAEESALC